MAKKFQIDTIAQIGGLLEALSGAKISGAFEALGTAKVNGTLTVDGLSTLANLTMKPQDATNEGGEVVLEGAGAFAANKGHLDRYQDSIRLWIDGGGNFIIPKTGDVTWNGDKVWTSGNDGVGSGLDADLLDGFQESVFMRRTATSDLTFGIPGTVGAAGNGIVFTGVTDNHKIYSEQYAANSTRLVIHTADDGDPDYFVIRATYSSTTKDTFEAKFSEINSLIIFRAKAGLEVTGATTLKNGASVTGDISVTGNVDGVKISTFKNSFDTHNHDSSYVKKLGDTMTGPLSIKLSSTTEPPLIAENGNGKIRFLPFTNDKNYIQSGTSDDKTRDLVLSGYNGVLLANLDLYATKVNVQGELSEGGTTLANKYASKAVNINAGNGLTGGGTLGADRTLSVDFTKVAAFVHNHDSAYAYRGTQNYSVAAADKRTVTPKELSTTTREVQFMFTTIANVSTGNDYADGLMLSTYSDSGGGKINAILAAKTEERLYLRQGAHNSDTWAAARKIAFLDEITWANVANKPTTFAPSVHNHDTDYYTKTLSDQRYLKVGDSNASTSGNLDVGGNIRTKGYLHSNKSTAQVSFAPGETRKTITHNIGSVQYQAALGANSVARHVAWENKTNNTLDIVLDSPYMGGTILVDVLMVGSWTY